MSARFDVRKVAQLAGLGLTAAEEARLQREFAAILEFVAKVQALPLDGVAPSVHAIAPPMPWAADEPQPCLSTEAALAVAPARLAQFVVVPAILAHAAPRPVAGAAGEPPGDEVRE